MEGTSNAPTNAICLIIPAIAFQRSPVGIYLLPLGEFLPLLFEASMISDVLIKLPADLEYSWWVSLYILFKTAS